MNRKNSKSCTFVNKEAQIVALAVMGKSYRCIVDQVNTTPNRVWKVLSGYGLTGNGGAIHAYRNTVTSVAHAPVEAALATVSTRALAAAARKHKRGGKNLSFRIVVSTK